jgi:hypothetical protein
MEHKRVKFSIDKPTEEEIFQKLCNLHATAPNNRHSNMSGDKFYNFCCKPFTNPEYHAKYLEMVNEILNDETFNINNYVFTYSYVQHALSNDNYELIEIIVKNQQFDFNNFFRQNRDNESNDFTTLHLLARCHDINELPRLELLKMIMMDDRFDGEFLNAKFNTDTILHTVCHTFSHISSSEKRKNKNNTSEVNDVSYVYNIVNELIGLILNNGVV